MNNSINIIFPNQLFKNCFAIDNKEATYLIEEHLYFNQYKFHKQKIAFHRSSMQKYKDYLSNNNIKVIYINSYEKNSDIREFLRSLDKSINHINIYDPIDNYLNKRILNNLRDRKISIFNNPSFINTNNDLKVFFKTDKKFFSHAVFYKQQRKKLNILMDETGEPVGGKFSFDDENRKKYPKNKVAPKLSHPKNDKYWNEAVEYTEKHFNDNFGSLSEYQYYPNNFKTSEDWFENFLKNRFKEFGDFEDAIIDREIFLNHSVLTPMLNTGLLTPNDIISKTLDFAYQNDIPINSTEGFVRQIIGWREFIRGMYICKGTYSRNLNFWKYSRKIPDSFYTGDTGITPIDDTIKKILKTGYCHHIERLMVLGNFMILCQFNPNEVYRWFMEMFIDAYDWVMVPNVYGMSQFSDGGLFATKPYISSSNYIKKMSNYKNDSWCETWDSLYWNFINSERDFFKSNPRLAMMIRIYDKMNTEKKNQHQLNAEKYFKSF